MNAILAEAKWEGSMRGGTAENFRGILYGESDGDPGLLSDEREMRVVIACCGRLRRRRFL